MKMGFENRSFENCPDERSLKRENRRSSDTVSCPELKFTRSHKRAASELQACKT